MSKTQLFTNMLITLGIFLGIHTPTAHANNAISPLKGGKSSVTEVRMITPFTAQGLNPKLKVVKEVEGMCWTSSLVNSARSNTWRCHSKDTVYDPCFKSTVHDQNTVACLKTPWEKDVVILKLSSPLPSTKVQHFNRKRSTPWALELSNGRLCTLTTGPSVNVAGMPMKYRCNSGSVVVGDIDRSLKKWFVFFLGNEDLYMHQTEVVSAWF